MIKRIAIALVFLALVFMEINTSTNASPIPPGCCTCQQQCYNQASFCYYLGDVCNGGGCWSGDWCESRLASCLQSYASCVDWCLLDQCMCIDCNK